MTVLMRTKIQTTLGCVNVTVSQVGYGSMGDMVEYTASILVRDGKELQYSIRYPRPNVNLFRSDMWEHVKHNLLDGLMRTAFKEVK